MGFAQKHPNNKAVGHSADCSHVKSTAAGIEKLANGWKNSTPGRTCRPLVGVVYGVKLLQPYFFEYSYLGMSLLVTKWMALLYAALAFMELLWALFRRKRKLEALVPAAVATPEPVFVSWMLGVPAHSPSRADAESELPEYCIAATALKHGLTLVTRDVDDFRHLRVTLFNPWDERTPGHHWSEAREEKASFQDGFFYKKFFRRSKTWCGARSRC